MNATLTGSNRVWKCVIRWRRHRLLNFTLSARRTGAWSVRRAVSTRCSLKGCDSVAVGDAHGSRERYCRDPVGVELKSWNECDPYRVESGLEMRDPVAVPPAIEFHAFRVAIERV